MPFDDKMLRTLGHGDLERGPDVKAMGLRQRHKVDKLQRISAAAIALFGRHGFDGTTLRDIANEADVALGTLSLYARDKRDLVLLIFNRVIPPLFIEGHKNSRATASLSDNMVNFFSPMYHSYAQNVTLYRTILGQIYNGPDSVHAEGSDAIRFNIQRHLAEVIELAIAQGSVRADIDIPVQARSFFYLYFAAVRVWLFQDDPDPHAGLESLRTMYAQHVQGLLPRD